MHKSSRIVIAALILLGTGGSPSVAVEKREMIVIPGRTEMAAQNVAPDILLAVLALDQTLHGERDLSKGLDAARLAKDASIISHDSGLAGSGFRYEGYALAGVTLSAIEPSRHEKQGRRLTGFAEFKHPNGLRAVTAFMTDYGYTAKEIVLHELQALPVTPPDARVMLKVLPLKEGQVLLAKRPASAEELLTALNARGKALPLARGDYMLIALSADRVLPGDRLEIAIAAPAGGEQGPAQPGTSFDMAGFPVTAVPWRSSGRAATASVFLRTEMHADKDDGRRLIGTVPFGGKR